MVAPTALPTQNPKTRLKREPQRREARPLFGALYANHDKQKQTVITFCKAAGGRFDSDGATKLHNNPKSKIL